MRLLCRKSRLAGEVEIPASKSHTIRAIAIASLAEGTSHIRRPLESADTRSAVAAYRALGARIDCEPEVWNVEGTGGAPQLREHEIDTGNSGTTLRIAMGSCTLVAEGRVRLTGDAQLRGRPAAPLAQALVDLGASVESLEKSGCPPFEVGGRLKGGATEIECKTSQYLTSLLMCTPLASGDSDIRVPLLNEAPYVGITLDWLEKQGIKVEFESDYSRFHVPGGQAYRPVDRAIPADFSSATFFLAGGALGDNDITCKGLDMQDLQGDRAVVGYLRDFGAITAADEQGVRVTARALSGGEVDLNATPDALPMIAALACFAEGETRLVNVPQARIKETDRIAVMAEELAKMGADIEELEDGLVVRPAKLRGAHVDGHGDHRVVMALAIAGTQATGDTLIEGADAVDITYPGFIDDLRRLGGEVTAQA